MKNIKKKVGKEIKKGNRRIVFLEEVTSDIINL